MDASLARGSTPEYVRSRLWLESLGPEAATADTVQRDRLREALDRTRANVLPIANQIQTDLPNLTVHDEDHLDALWLLAEQIGGDVHFNPAEAFVFGVAVLIHDLGLAVAAYPGGREELRTTPEWRNALGLRLRETRGRAPSLEELARPGEDAASEADRDVLRERHAQQAVDLASIALGQPPGQTHLVDDEELREQFAHICGQLAASHWWAVPELRRLADTRLAIAELPHDWEVDVLKLACLLRLADYSHLDSRRAPKLRRLSQRPQGDALPHWDMQSRLARVAVAGSRLRYQSLKPFGRDESDAWWLAADTLAAVDEELRQVDSLLQDLGRQTFAVTGVIGAGDPARLRESVETTGWEPVDARLRVSDVASLVRRLGGRKLYGARATVPLREIIQNGTDAIEARRRVQSGWSAGSIDVAFAREGDWVRFEVKDDGVGMAPEMLAGPLLDFGRSAWRDRAIAQMLPGLAATDFEPVGRFGIGFFSAFMFDRPVRIQSRFHASGTDDTYFLEFPAGLSRRAILRRADPTERMGEPGTIVTFEVPVSARDKEFEKLLADPAPALGRLCATLEVDLSLIEGGLRTQVIRGGDWRELDPSALIERVGGTANQARIERVRPLHGDDGELLGRLVAIPSRLYLENEAPGLLTVGGFQALRAGSMAGVLIGGAPNLARSQARALVSSAEFARWASEQAELWVGAGLSQRDSIGLAAAVAGYGGDVGDLPICFGVEKSLNRDQLIHWAAERDEVILWEYVDEDELRISGGFEPTFTPGPNTIVIDAPIGSSDLGATVDRPVTEPPGLLDLVHDSLARAWGLSTDRLLGGSEPADTRVIGRTEVDDVLGTTATLFMR